MAELIDEYVKFCILDFANVESIPMMSKIKIYLSAR